MLLPTVCQRVQTDTAISSWKIMAMSRPRSFPGWPRRPCSTHVAGPPTGIPPAVAVRVGCAGPRIEQARDTPARTGPHAPTMPSVRPRAPLRPHNTFPRSTARHNAAVPLVENWHPKVTPPGGTRAGWPWGPLMSAVVSRCCLELPPPSLIAVTAPLLCACVRPRDASISH